MIGPSHLPLAHTAYRLALDDIEVAGPVLEHSPALSEEHLLSVIAQKTQEHLLAVTRRSDIGETVSHALVERGDERVVVALLENATAKISQQTYEAVGERAQTQPALHGPLIRRDRVPVELLNNIYLAVEENLRQEILARYDQVAPADFEAALQRSRERVSLTMRRPAQDAAKVKVRVAEYRRRGELAPPLLIRLLREGEASRSTFVGVFAALCDVDDAVVRFAVESGDIDALALLCRAAEFERAIFVSLAIALAGSEGRLGKVEEFSALYQSVPIAAAQRALRFWKMRNTSFDAPPA
jgi:uncharacterized protein (DUF2336 family)